MSVDALTLVVAVAIAVLAIPLRAVRGAKPILSRKNFSSDLLNGACVFPFVFLMISIFSNHLWGKLNKIRLSVALAGAVGLTFVIGELWSSCGKQS